MTDLSIEDRNRMRAIVRRVHRQFFPENPSNRDCDNLIESLGPETAAAMVKAAVDGGHLD